MTVSQTKPAVSVVIPTYNHGAYVLRCVDSVFAQTFTDYETIVVNDGSTDQTSDLLRPLSQARRIRYYEQSNQGMAATRNRGLAEAGGEFIALLDDDDVWPPDKLAWQVDYLRLHPELVLVGGGVQAIDEQDRKTGPEEGKTRAISFDDLFAGNPWGSPGQVLIRSTALQQIGGFDPSVWGADDLDLFFRLARVGPLRDEKRLALNYRLHAASGSRSYRRMYENAKKVMEKHLPTGRPDLRRQAYRMLYRFSARGALNRIKQDLLKARVSGVTTEFSLLTKFVRPAFQDPYLVLCFLGDLAPRGLGNLLRRAKWIAPSSRY
jgi:glycosyltransferase involved in cell wall biosynthesis